MALFGAIRNTYKKSEAAAVVQTLLEAQARDENFDLDPASHANQLVAAIWDQKPDIFNGSFGQRPHKLTVAATALAHEIHQVDRSDGSWPALVLSLGNLLSELEANGQLYPLNSLDHYLLRVAVSVFDNAASQM